MAAKDDENEDSLVRETEKNDQDVTSAEEDTKQTEDQNSPQEPEPSEPELPAASAKKTKVHHRVLHWIFNHKKVTIPVLVLVVLAVLTAVPFTRFAIAGTFLKQTFKVKVIDQETKKPVTSAMVALSGKTVKTDSKGQASLKVKVGSATLTVEKKYYKDASSDVVVPVLKQKKAIEVSIKATGRQVPVAVVNKITGKPVANIKIAASGTEAKTNKDGKAILVLPAGKTSVEATLSATGFNTIKTSVKVTIEEDSNNLSITPSGKLYFLSNLSGTIDVVKSNLDGTERQIVLLGTGKEDRHDTVLLASRDWKYLALYSKRDGGNNPKLFLVDTSTDKVKTMDEGDASFTLIGWSDHRFVYTVTRNTIQNWQNNKQALKSYNAEMGQLSTLDQSSAEGTQDNYAYQQFGNFFVVKGQVMYSVQWSRNYTYYYSPNLLTGKNHSIRGIQASGQNKKDYKTFDATQFSYISANSYEPNSIIYAVPVSNNYDFYEFEDNAVKQIQFNQNDFFNGPYSTYLLSPAGDKTFWSEARDGKNALFVGDQNGKGGKQVATLSSYQTYGWYTDDYLLVSKDGSQLYAMPATGLATGQQPLKITDYYKPDYTYRGYGGGYGGL